MTKLTDQPLAATALEYSPPDISEDTIRENMPEILDILLTDRTASTSRIRRNIIWANRNYVRFGKQFYAPTSEIKPNLVTKEMGKVIMPRALKSVKEQKSRAKSKAEIFTPISIVKRQTDSADEGFANDDLETYVKRSWLEIACGEAPYIATRYDMYTGEIIPLPKRTGALDRKLKRINAEVDDPAQYQRLAELAYQACYGFEWNGDSLLIARENLLYTYRDYYTAKWGVGPSDAKFKTIAEIISYNIFQMDGLKLIIPLSDKPAQPAHNSPTLFPDLTKSPAPKISNKGRRVKIMNWETNRLELFDKDMN
jgi:hypothetical protein